MMAKASSVFQVGRSVLRSTCTSCLHCIKPHGSMRHPRCRENDRKSSWLGVVGQSEESFPRGLKPEFNFGHLMYGLKPVPFKLTHYLARRALGETMSNSAKCLRSANHVFDCTLPAHLSAAAGATARTSRCIRSGLASFWARWFW